jgi:hypothetical protein
MAPEVTAGAGVGAVCAVVALAVVVTATGSDLDPFGGGGTWQSLLLAVMEAGLVIGGSVWLVDMFRRRYSGPAHPHPRRFPHRLTRKLNASRPFGAWEGVQRPCPRRLQRTSLEAARPDVWPASGRPGGNGREA